MSCHARVLVAVFTFGAPLAGQARPDATAAIWGDRIELVEELRLGRLDGPSEQVFGDVVAAVQTADGDMWIADGLLKTILRFDGQGRFLGSVGREGRGPGEFGLLIGMALHPDGGVRVWDPANQRIHAFESDGSLDFDSRVPSWGIMGAIRLPSFRIDSEGRHYVLAASPPTNGDVRELFWARFSADPSEAQSIRVPNPNTFGSYHAIQTLSDVADGGIVSGRRDEYRFTLITDGDSTVVRRDYDPVPYSARERIEAQRLEDQFAERNGRPNRSLPAEKPIWVDFQVDSDDRLWIELFGRSQTQEFDVVGLSGEYYGRVRLVAPIGEKSSAILWAHDRTVWVLEHGAFDEQYVVRYSVG